MADSNGHGAEFRGKGLGVMIIFAGLLLVQVAIPVQRLLSGGEDGPTRFGWQMFAMVRDRPMYLVRHASGRTDTVQLADHLVRHRPEIDLPTVLPPHLCRQLKDVSEVVVRWPRSADQSVPRRVEYPCP